MPDITKRIEYSRAMLDPEVIKSYRPDHGAEETTPPQGGSGLVTFERNGNSAGDSQAGTTAPTMIETPNSSHASQASDE